MHRYLPALSLLVACGAQPLTPDEVRAEIDSPSGHLSAETLPDVADDFLLASDTWGSETSAWGWVDQAGGGGGDVPPAARWVAEQAAEAGLLEDNLANAFFLADLFCATDFIVQLSEFEDCDRGETCEVELVLSSCLLRMGDNDPDASGKIRFTLSEEETAEYDRGSLELSFEDWRATRSDGYWGDLHGLIGIEGTSFSDRTREELLYSADFTHEVIDPEEVGLFNDGVIWSRRVKAALRFAYESDGVTDQGTVDLLTWVDEDGDGSPDGSVVMRFAVEASPLEDGTLVGATLELIDADGTWTCSWSLTEQTLEDGATRVSSAGTCTDPDGETVDFDGSVLVD